MSELPLTADRITFKSVRCTSSHAHILDTLSVLPDFPESMYFPGTIVRFGLYIPHDVDMANTAPEALVGVIVSGLHPHTIRFVIKSQHPTRDSRTHVRMKSDIILDHRGDHSLMSEISSFCGDLGVEDPEKLLLSTNDQCDTHSRYYAHAPSSRLMSAMLTQRMCNTEPLLVGSLCSDRLPSLAASSKILSQAIYTTADDLEDILA